MPRIKNRKMPRAGEPKNAKNEKCHKWRSRSMPQTADRQHLRHSPIFPLVAFVPAETIQFDRAGSAVYGLPRRKAGKGQTKWFMDQDPRVAAVNGSPSSGDSSE